MLPLRRMKPRPPTPLDRMSRSARSVRYTFNGAMRLLPHYCIKSLITCEKLSDGRPAGERHARTSRLCPTGNAGEHSP
jgi:hypothetical protein